MIPETEESYMFHPAKKKMIELQSKALEIPVVFSTTKALKEKELKDLKKLMKKAKEEYELDGIVTGALYSNYQRERIKNVCEELGLKTFSPLWHKNQEAELKELLRLGFKFILTSVAALGLNKDWLGKIIDNKRVEELVKLREGIGLNVAGEGGEYESFVLDAPIFKKKIKILDSEIIEYDENTAKLIIKKAELINK
jgi:asparagine synthase (glutamine-hydrolysing)